MGPRSRRAVALAAVIAMCECYQRPPNMPQYLGAVFESVDPSTQNVQITDPNFNEAQSLPVTPEPITLEDLMGFATIVQIARFLSDL